MGLTSPALTSPSPLFFGNPPTSMPSPHSNLTSPVMPQMAYRAPQGNRPRKRQATELVKQQLQQQQQQQQQQQTAILQQSPQIQAQMQAQMQAHMTASLMSPPDVSMAHHQAIMSPGMATSGMNSAEQLRQLAQRQQFRRAMSANMSPGSPLVQNHMANSPHQSPLITAQQMNQMMTSPMLDASMMSPTSATFQHHHISAVVANASAATGSGMHPITPSVLMHLQHEKARNDLARLSPHGSPASSPRMDAQ